MYEPVFSILKQSSARRDFDKFSEMAHYYKLLICSGVYNIMEITFVIVLQV